jgi:hypothetical protein
MPEQSPHDREDGRWHVSKTINLGHIVTTAVMFVSVMWFFFQQDSRISQVELNIKHIQEVRASDQARTDKKFDEIRAYMLRIESKLDRIIESDRER